MYRTLPFRRFIKFKNDQNHPALLIDKSLMLLYLIDYLSFDSLFYHHFQIIVLFTGHEPKPAFLKPQKFDRHVRKLKYQIQNKTKGETAFYAHQIHFSQFRKKIFNLFSENLLFLDAERYRLL